MSRPAPQAQASDFSQRRLGRTTKTPPPRTLAWMVGTLLVGTPTWAFADSPTAAQVYEHRCANCHGFHGRNPQLLRIFPDLPDFTNPQWQAAHTMTQLKDVILHGKGAMPGYQGDLDGLPAGDLVRYLRTFAQKGLSSSAKAPSTSNPRAPVARASSSPHRLDPPTVEQFYQTRCAGCHGANGRNPRLLRIFPDLPDFTNPQWQAAHTMTQLKDAILHGKGAMPGYQGDLDGLRVSDLVQYLRTFAQKGQRR